MWRDLLAAPLIAIAAIIATGLLLELCAAAVRACARRPTITHESPPARSVDLLFFVYPPLLAGAGALLARAPWLRCAAVGVTVLGAAMIAVLGLGYALSRRH